MDGGHRGRIDRSPQRLRRELPALELAESTGPQPPHQAHALHVRHDVDRLRRSRELIGPDGQKQEDGAIRIGSHDVAQHAKGVVIGPLHVVDQQRHRSLAGRRAHRHAGQVERPQQLGIAREGFQPGLVTTRHGVDHPLDRCLRRCSGDGFAQRRRSEDALGEQEGAADLLVGGHRDGGKSGASRQLGRRQQQARLADAGLALEGHRGQVGPRVTQLLVDGRHLGRAAHDRPGDPAQLDGERALGLDAGIEGTAAQRLHPGELGRRAGRIPDWGAWGGHGPGIMARIKEFGHLTWKLSGRALRPGAS